MAATLGSLSVQPYQTYGFPIQPPSYADAVLLAANTAENIAVPAGAIYVRLSGTGDFYASYQTSTDATELVSNGAMASDTIWTKGTGWTIAAGVATSDASQAGNSDLSQTIATLETGRAYRVVFTVSGYSAGNVRAVVGAGTAGTNRAADGTFTETIICGATTAFVIRADLDFAGNIDNVSVKPIAKVPVDDTTGTAAELIKGYGPPEWRYVSGLSLISVVSAGTPTVTASFFTS